MRLRRYGCALIRSVTHQFVTVPLTLDYELAKAGGGFGELIFKISELGRAVAVTANIGELGCAVMANISQLAAGLALSGAIGGNAFGSGFRGS